jgi:hypothetical protein
MAIARRFSIKHDEAFPYGAYVIGEVEQVNDFDRSTRDHKVQQVDKETGLPLWSVQVLDADPEAPKHAKTVTVKITAPVQPVPPGAEDGQGDFPYAMVVFENLTAMPYAEQVNEDFSRVVWSFKATGLTDRKPRGLGEQQTAKPADKSPAKASA